MRYFYEILDYFNKINNRRLLLEQGDGRKVVWSYNSDGGWTTGITTEKAKDKLKQLGYGDTTVPIHHLAAQAGQDSNNKKQVITPNGSTIYVWFTKGEDQPQQDEKNKAPVLNDPNSPSEPVENQPNTSAPQEGAPQPVLTQEQQEELQRQQEVINSLQDLDEAAKKTGLTPPEQTQLGQPKVMSLVERIKRAAYFTVKKLLGREDKIEADKARIGTANTLTRALNFITAEMPDPQKDFEAFQKWQSEARFLYEKIKINGHDINPVDRKILIESEDGEYTSALGDVAILTDFKNKLEQKFKEAFKTVEDPTGEKIRLKESDRTGQISTKNLGENFEVATLSIINMSGFLERAKQKCSFMGAADVQKAKERCSNAKAELNQAFEATAKIMKENGLDFMKLTTGLNEDIIGKTPEMKSLMELITETAFAGAKDGVKKLFLGLSYLVNQNPLYKNASIASRMAHVVGLGDKQDVHLFYDSKQKAEEASEYSQHKYVEVTLDEIRNNPDKYYHPSDKEKMKEHLNKLEEEGKSTIFLINPSLKVTAQEGNPKTKVSTAGGIQTLAVTVSVANVGPNGERDNSGHEKELIKNKERLKELQEKQNLTTEEKNELKDIQEKLPALEERTKQNIERGNKFADTIEQLSMEVLRNINPNASEEELKEKMREGFKEVAESKKIHLNLLSLEQISTTTSTGKEIVIDTLDKTKEVLDSKLTELGVEIDVKNELIDTFSDQGELNPKKLNSVRKKLNDPKYKELKGIVESLFDKFQEPLVSLEEDPNKHKEQVKSRREALLRTVTGLENISLASNLENADPEIRKKASTRIMADLMVNGAASQKDLAVIDVNLSRGESTIFSHNIPLQRMSEALMNGKATFNPTKNGYSITDIDTGATISVIYEELAGPGSQSTNCRVDYNEKAKKLGLAKGTYISTKRRENASKIYDKKLELLEQIINDQKKLLLKLIDKPEIIRGD